MCAPGSSDIAHDLEITSRHLATLAITIYMLGLAVGPMLVAPLSEVYGRLTVYHSASLNFTAFVVGNALSRTAAQFMEHRIHALMKGCPFVLAKYTSRPRGLTCSPLGRMRFGHYPAAAAVRIRKIKAKAPRE